MKIFGIILAMTVAATVYATEYHVAVTGNDAGIGSAAKPFRTIQRAANLAQPGDVVTVHEGIYREHVNPPRGGDSDSKRITYQAAPGEKVVITGSEVVKNWQRVTNDTWQVMIPNQYFGQFNPFTDLVRGEWGDGRGKHTGQVYLNGEWLDETHSLDTVLKPAGKKPFWFTKVEGDNTTIWAQFPGIGPNAALVEINKRPAVFYPSRRGINYITVRGFELCDAATPWAGAMSEQVGLIGTHWSKGWIIENNYIHHSVCTGITLGRYELPAGEKPPATAPGYVKSIKQAVRDGWSKETIGSHIVRNNRITDCEKNAIHGSLGASFSEITGNDIHNIAIRGWITGPDLAGIKFLGGVDMIIRDNHIYRCGSTGGIWLDWMAQGAQITGNLLHDNLAQDIFCEMQHGPLVIANNLLLSRSRSFWINSKSLAIVHNLITAPIRNTAFDPRDTPYHPAHSTAIAGMHNAPAGDHRFYNNLFITPGSLNTIDNATLPCFAAGNVFTKGAQPSKFDADALVKPEFSPGLKLEEKADGWYLTLTADRAWHDEVKRKRVTTELLGHAKIPNLPYENPDGSPLRITTDYLGNQRDPSNAFPGPFEVTANGMQTFKVWPKP